MILAVNGLNEQKPSWSTKLYTLERGVINVRFVITFNSDEKHEETLYNT